MPEYARLFNKKPKTAYKVYIYCLGGFDIVFTCLLGVWGLVLVYFI